jgi:hypothetical protein
MQTKLRQLLDCFEEAPQGLSLLAVAREMELSAAQVENLLEFWIRKGRIRLSVDQPDCKICGDKPACPFVITLPRYYELVPDKQPR